MPPRACLSPRSGVRRRKDSSERAVWLSGRPLRPTRIRPNPPNPGQMARFPGKTALQSAVKAVRIPSPYLHHPSGKPAPGRPSNTPPKVPFTRRRPPPTPKLQTRNPTPAPLWTSALLQGDRHGGTGDRHRRNAEPLAHPPPQPQNPCLHHPSPSHPPRPLPPARSCSSPGWKTLTRSPIPSLTPMTQLAEAFEQGRSVGGGHRVFGEVPEDHLQIARRQVPGAGDARVDVDSEL